MQKKIRSHGEVLKPVTLYLDDLEKIVDILRQVSDSAEISTKETILSNLNELTKLKRESLNELYIRLDEPYISLNLMPNTIWLFIGKDEPISRGLFEQIKHVLGRRTCSCAWLINSPWIMGLLLGIGINLFSPGIAEGNWLDVASGGFIICLSILLFLYGYNRKFRKYSIIIPKYRSEAPSFFKRNADAILLNIISAILGGIITFAVAKLTEAIP